jgi:hypothetical protein
MTEPDTSAMLAELAAAVAERERLLKRRDEIIRALMKTGTPREEIAAAADLKVSRLYQV